MLFKDKDELNQASNYEAIAKELCNDISPVFEGLDKYQPRNDYEELKDRRTTCGWTYGKKNEEERWCHCFVDRYEQNDKCDGCSFKEYRKEIVGAKFENYAIPVHVESEDVGDIDLIMDYNGQLYGVEFKGDWNNDTILRMFSEIETYFYIATKSENFNKYYPNIKKAILFMEGSAQERQITGKCKNGKAYRHEGIYTKKLLKEHQIDVFCLKDKGDCFEVIKMEF